MTANSKRRMFEVPVTFRAELSCNIGVEADSQEHAEALIYECAGDFVDASVKAHPVETHTGQLHRFSSCDDCLDEVEIESVGQVKEIVDEHDESAE